jgi:hypothetical protein
MTDLTACADRAEQASTLADAARREAVQATEALRRADAERKARGLVARRMTRHAPPSPADRRTPPYDSGEIAAQ